MEKYQYLLGNLQKWLAGLGYVESGHNNSISKHFQPDLVVQKENQVLAAEAKVANVYRSQVFPALVGDLILRASGSVNEGDVLIALLIKRMSEKAVEDLKDYARNFLPALNWFLLDESGDGMACLNGQMSELMLDELPVDSISKQRGAPRRSLFSLNNQQLLKMMLLPGINPRYWGGPEKKPKSIVSLSNSAHIPQPSVSSFISKFEQEGYIRRKEGMPVVVRHRELLDEWFYAAKNALSDRVPVKQMYGEPINALINQIRVRSNSQKRGPDMIIGSHLACHLHGLGRSNVNVGWAYSCLPLSDIMENYDLVEDNSSSPAFWLVPDKAKVVERGWVIIDDVPVCDILQCYLDVRESQARGQEQADYILNEILMPHFAGRM